MKVTPKVKELAAKIAGLGLNVVHMSVWPETQLFHDKYAYEAMIVACLPDQAFLVTVHATFVGKNQVLSSAKFKVTAQITWSDARLLTDSIARNATGSEGYAYPGVFDINTYVLDTKDGIEFLSETLRLTAGLLLTRFTKYLLMLFFVPEHSDMCRQLEAQYGEFSTETWDYFNRLVYQDLPKEMFVTTQFS